MPLLSESSSICTILHHLIKQYFRSQWRKPSIIATTRLGTNGSVDSSFGWDKEFWEEAKEVETATKDQVGGDIMTPWREVA